MKLLSPVRLFATPWTIAYHAPLPMGFFRQEYWSGLPFPFPGYLSDSGLLLIRVNPNYISEGLFWYVLDNILVNILIPIVFEEHISRIHFILWIYWRSQRKKVFFFTIMIPRKYQWNHYASWISHISMATLGK